VRRLGACLRDRRRRRDVLEVDARRVQRAVPEELLDRVQGRSALHLGKRPAVPEPMRVDPLLDPGLGRQPLAERPHVAVPKRPFGRMQMGLIQYLESQRERGRIVAENVGPAALTLFAALHSLAFLERLGMHGGKFNDAVIRAMVRSLRTGLAPMSE
jgi:hypothetical protein